MSHVLIGNIISAQQSNIPKVKMQLISILSLLFSASVVKADANSDLVSDVAILNFALILENLENAFYVLGTSMYKASDYAGLPLNAPSIVKSFQDIAAHEAIHVAALTATIQKYNGTVNPACNYTFGLTDGKSFIATARVLERVGTSAYNGAISKVKTPGFLTVGASIAEIEARHASFLNTINRMNPMPNAFETPLSPRAITTLAAGLLKCPFTLPYAPFPALTLTAASANVADVITFSGTPTAPATHCAFLNGLSPVFAPVTGQTCVVPAGLSGDVFVFLTSDGVTDVYTVCLLSPF